jgi:hypothetical protein
MYVCMYEIVIGLPKIHEIIVLGYSKENEVVSTECLVLGYNQATCQTPSNITSIPEIRNTGL